MLTRASGYSFPPAGGRFPPQGGQGVWGEGSPHNRGVPGGRLPGSALRILIAEDDEALGDVLARGLREQGYVVDLVPDGETAAAYLRFYQYEVAVLDWRMPKLSGLDLVQKLRRGGTTTPVLMLTARDTPADRITGLDAGADD